MSHEPVHQPTPAGQVPPIVCPGTIRPRDPASFSGLDDRDVEDWLSTFERISTHNKWDDAMKLNNVGFSFTHLAELWFNNHRREMSTWAEFKERFMKAFGRPEVRKLQAEQRLRVRAQKTGEDFTSYIEDVVDLCKRVDPSMLETEKVKHILKGIDDDAFQMLLSKDPRTVSDVIRLCQSYDELRKQRAFTRRPLAQNEPLASLAVDLDDPSVLVRIKEIVREEVARQLCHAASNTTPELGPVPQSTLRHVVQEQVAEVLPSFSQQTPVAAPITFADVAGRLAQTRTPFRLPAPPRPLPQARVPTQSMNPWRTPDNRPICFSCHYPGHVARYCRRRVLPANGPPPECRYPYYGPTYGSPPTLPQTASDSYPPSASDRQPFADRRSQSPRRRSLSPMRRRSTPATEEN